MVVANTLSRPTLKIEERTGKIKITIQGWSVLNAEGVFGDNNSQIQGDYLSRRILKILYTTYTKCFTLK